LWEAELLLNIVFPEESPADRMWNNCVSRYSDDAARIYESDVSGVIRGLIGAIKGGQIDNAADRVETEAELVDQDEELLKKVFLAAASVIAGGTLEDVLSRYCQKHGIVI
jgi:hypothetical protein